jgi:DnaD/phage-associated family protein
MEPKRTFGGFQAGKVGKVIIPDPFFSDLLPLIDDLAELKLTVYCFWALQQREGKYRYLRLRDLLADQVLLDGLGDSPEAALRHALECAVQRGTLLVMAVPGPSGDDELLYFMNTDKGRRAVEALERGNWTPGSEDRPVGLIADRPNIFTLYEQNIGPLTPLLAETLRDAEHTYPYEWIDEAMRIAIEGNKRNWRYIEAILKRWATEGKSAPRQQPSPEEPNRYLQDAYFQRRRSNEEDEP